MLKNYAKYAALTAVMALIATLSVHSGVQPHHPLLSGEESRLVGGFSCATSLGITAGFAVGALTPCSIICATLGFYSLGVMMFAC
jgi:hypothetical protein